jgi:hypothetical protein
MKDWIKRNGEWHRLLYQGKEFRVTIDRSAMYRRYQLGVQRDDGSFQNIGEPLESDRFPEVHGFDCEHPHKMAPYPAGWWPRHEGDLILRHNEHRAHYLSLKSWLDIQMEEPDWLSPEERKNALATDSLWVLHWYPDTPVGFHTAAAATFEALMQAVWVSEQLGNQEEDEH